MGSLASPALSIKLKPSLESNDNGIALLCSIFAVTLNLNATRPTNNDIRVQVKAKDIAVGNLLTEIKESPDNTQASDV
ncbi:uncharacterized protein ColSpa_02033 [Colletotrichum spaethianum]|uniref:Uncharacterized protein n=1 Tax=Colletotrichum spaethianum TaxID=700344 RepID=A0AA37L4S4_9PEZI|nr:uncharacterized protein ColSpa_02033 [Colletotrichum spaethianum]GKT41852.1 hypothetical protein ColSpa_02033 [Colletotrichum spaethianum]